MTHGATPNEGRRSFLNWFLGGTVGALLAAIAYPVTRFLSPPNVPEASTNEIVAGTVTDAEFAEKGFKIVRFGALPVIVLRAGERDYRAFNATCTHLDCIVEYEKASKKIICNCHNGEYDLTGRNVAGPPPRPLTRYDVNVVAGASGQPDSIVVTKA